MCRMCVVEIDTGRGPALQPACMIPVAPGHGGRHGERGHEEGAGRRPRVPADQPPARLPRVRQGRRVPAAGPDALLRPGREPLRRGEAPLREADHDQRPRGPRPRALHPLRPLHAVRRRGRRRHAHPLPGPRQPDPGQHLPRPPLRQLLQRQHRADLPGGRAHRHALPVQGPPVGPRPGREHLHDAARSGAARSCSRAATRSSGTRASTSTRSTGAGCATRAASASGPSTATTASAARWPAEGDALVEVPWGEALSTAADALRGGRAPTKVAVLGGARLTNESAYAWAKLAKGVHRHRPRRRAARRRAPRRGRARPARAPRSTRCAPPAAPCSCSLPTSRRSCPSSSCASATPWSRDGVTVVELASQRTPMSDLAAATLLHRPGAAGEVVRALLAGLVDRRRSAASTRRPSRPRPACWPTGR